MQEERDLGKLFGGTPPPGEGIGFPLLNLHSRLLILISQIAVPPAEASPAKYENFHKGKLLFYFQK